MHDSTDAGVKVFGDGGPRRVTRTATDSLLGVLADGRCERVFGRMQRPANVTGIRTIEWEGNGRIHRLPAIFHAAWQAPDGRAGVVLANWTNRRRRAGLADRRLGTRVVLHRCGASLASRALKLQRAGAPLTVMVPALGCVLLETATARPPPRSERK